MVTSDGVSELVYGVVKGGETGLVRRVDPGSEDRRRTKDCQVEHILIRGSRWFPELGVSGVAWITS